MKYRALIIVLLSIWSVGMIAQDMVPDSLDTKVEESVEVATRDSSENHFRFVYIDHEPTTPVSTIHQRLEKLHDDAMESGSYLIIYLADEDQPLISFTNLSDPDPSGQRNEEEAYNDLIKQMYVQTAHEVRAFDDLDIIKGYLGTGGAFPLFVEQDGQTKLNYKSVVLDFYVGPHFWDLRGYEDLLAELFVSLKIDERLNTSEFPPTKLAFNVMKPRGVQLFYQKGMPFGRKNLGKINEKIEIKDY